MRPIVPVGAAVALVSLGLSAGVAVSSSTAATSSQASPTAPSQEVSAAVLVDPLQVTLKLKATHVKAGMAASASASVKNRGKVGLTSLAAALTVPPNVVVKPSGSQALGGLSPGTTKTATWSVCATTPGNYSIRAQASATDAAGHQFITYSQFQTLVVTKGSGKC